MGKPVTSLLASHVISVRLNDTVATVEKIMDSHHVSCVPVINAEGGCFGVISAPDLVHFHNARKNPLAERAWEMCTHKIIEVSSDTSIDEAAKLMLESNIHHLAVIDEGRIKGIVSSLDILKECLPTSNLAPTLTF